MPIFYFNGPKHPSDNFYVICLLQENTGLANKVPHPSLISFSLPSQFNLYALTHLSIISHPFLCHLSPISSPFLIHLSITIIGLNLSRTQILKFSFEPKNERKCFCISALASKMGQIIKIMAHYHAN